MIKEELYKRTVDILYQAYFNDTLIHSSCTACAVANIILANHNTAPVKEDAPGVLRLSWPFGEVSYSHGVSWYSVVSKGIEPDNYANKLISVTGYDWEQLRKIENAFEKASYGVSEEDWMFNGLVAVLEVLKEIHQVEDDAEVKKRFSNHYASLTAQQ
jgi:hypothetical protein